MKFDGVFGRVFPATGGSFVVEDVYGPTKFFLARKLASIIGWSIDEDGMIDPVTVDGIPQDWNAILFDDGHIESAHGLFGSLAEYIASRCNEGK